MSYEKQTWNKYDDLKTEEENIENGAVVTDNRMNHIEEGIYSHTIDISNPHKVTAAQVGLGNIQNFGLATEDEAKQGISNAKYMTPSLTQAVLSANINSIAYANSADGTDGFTTVYPNLNLLDGTKDFSGTWTNSSSWVTDGTYKGLTVKKRTAQWNSIYKTFTAPKDGAYTFSAYVKSSGNNANVYRYGAINSIGGSQTPIQRQIGNNFDWIRDSITLNLKANDNVWVRYEISGAGTDSILWTAGYKWEQGSTATPNMPSSSEVTADDWPKFVGFSNTVKTNKSASDYTWFPVKDSELTNKVESHVNNKANPHAVTASQVGAYSKQEIDTKLSKTIMADDSGKVTVKDLKVSGSIDLPTSTTSFPFGYGITATAERVGNQITLSIASSNTATIPSGTTMNEKIPEGYRPKKAYSIDFTTSGTTYCFYNIGTNGSIQYGGNSIPINSSIRGVRVYYTNDAFPAS